MNSSILLEINRAKSLMGLKEENFPTNSHILNEGGPPITQLGKLLIHADEAFESVDDVKKLLNGLNDLIPKGSKVVKLTAQEIDDMAQGLKNQKTEIANAARADKLGSLSTNPSSFYKKFNDFKIKVQNAKGGASIDNNQMFINSVDSALNKVFDNPDGKVYQAYSESYFEMEKLIDDEYLGGAKKPNKKELKEFYKGYFEDELKKKGIVFKSGDKNFDRLETWLDKKIETDLDGWQKEKGLTYDEKPVTNIEDIKKVSGKWRFLNNLIKKFKNIGKTFDELKVSLDKNLNLLKSFPAEKIVIENSTTPTTEFQSLVRAIAYDIDQIDGIEKNARKIWDEVLDELRKEGDTELVRAIENSLIYGEPGSNIMPIWKPESFKQYFQDLKTRYPNTPESVLKNAEQISSFMEDFTKFKNFVKSVFKDGISGLFKNIKEYIKTFEFSWRNIWMEVFFGQIRTFKTLGKMFGTKGFGTWKRLLQNLLWQYIKLIVFKKVLIIVPVTINTLIAIGFEKNEIDRISSETKKTGYDVLKDEIVKAYTEFNASDLLPFDIEWEYNLIKSGLLGIDRELSQNPDKTKSELVMSKNEAFDEWWDSMGQEEQKALLKGFAEPQGFLQPFGRLYQFVTQENPNQQQFLKYNGLKESDLEKFKKSLVVYKDIAVNEDALNIDLDKVKQVFKNPKNVEKISENVTITDGAVRDKNGYLYRVIGELGTQDGKSYKFSFQKVPYEPFYFYAKVAPASVSDPVLYKIYYAATTDEKPEPATLNDIKKANPKTIPNINGFEKEDDAKDVVKKLNDLDNTLIEDKTIISAKDFADKYL
jgi:hypothetical protein